MGIGYTDFNDETYGLKPASVVVRDYAGDTIVDDRLVKAVTKVDRFTCVSRQPGGTSQHWEDASGTVSIKASIEMLDGSARRIQLEVQNLSFTKQITQIDVQLPTLSLPASPAYKAYTGYRGGGPGSLGIKDWKEGQGNTGSWPGYGTSPVASIWDEKTGQTLAVTFFNDQLQPVALYWFSGPSNSSGEDRLGFNPFLRFNGNLEPRQVMTLPVEFREMSGGPPAHWAHYRARFLQPFMAAMGYPESATFDASGTWGFGHGSGPGLAAQARQLAWKYRLQGLIQWPTPDAKSLYFEPHHVKDPFFSDFLAASQTAGLKHFGTLIVPDASPRIPTDAALRQTQTDANGKEVVFDLSVLPLNQRADLTRKYNLLYAKLLRDHGVTIAYYDVGGGPHDNRPPLDWLRTYADYKRAGIAVMGETGADVASWISGVWFEFPYSRNDYSMLKALLPGCALFAFSQTQDKKDVGHGAESWWKDAERKGITPLLDATALQLRAVGE